MCCLRLKNVVRKAKLLFGCLWCVLTDSEIHILLSIFVVVEGQHNLLYNLKMRVPIYRVNLKIR